MTDDAVLQDDSDFGESGTKIRDLSFWPPEDGGPAAFVLQHRWH